MNVFERIGEIGLVPVVEIDDAERAEGLGRALAGAGLPCAEITFRTPAAAAAIRTLRQSCPDVLVGAGTVLTVEQADAAIDAGAQFLVAPGFNPAVVDHARTLGATFVPGACTPTEIDTALRHRIDVLKFFPAEVAGGLAMLKAVAPVYPGVRYIPTGGIGPANVADYLGLRQVLACGGSWMVRKELIAAGDFGSIEQLAAEAVRIARTALGSRSARPGG
jgi:2-dehydro-3-deoxyphosphogluconate aldolase/(4S)-4-hydroxy-2-oxoglutarate aldolase